MTSSADHNNNSIPSDSESNIDDEDDVCYKNRFTERRKSYKYARNNRTIASSHTTQLPVKVKYHSQGKQKNVLSRNMTGIIKRDISQENTLPKEKSSCHENRSQRFVSFLLPPRTNKTRHHKNDFNRHCSKTVPFLFGGSKKFAGSNLMEDKNRNSISQHRRNHMDKVEHHSSCEDGRKTKRPFSGDLWRRLIGTNTINSENADSTKTTKPPRFEKESDKRDMPGRKQRQSIYQDDSSDRSPSDFDFYPNKQSGRHQRQRKKQCTVKGNTEIQDAMLDNRHKPKRTTPHGYIVRSNFLNKTQSNKTFGSQSGKNRSPKRAHIDRSQNKDEALESDQSTYEVDNSHATRHTFNETISEATEMINKINLMNELKKKTRQMSHQIEDSDSSTESPSNSKRNTPQKHSERSLEQDTDDHEVITFADEFAELEEYRKYLMKTLSFFTAQENMDKNRFKGILAPDSTRVILGIEKAGETNYYNANEIHVGGAITYIAAQSPNSPTTADDFWRLILQYNIETIVMLCKCTENGHMKCHQYWADDGMYVGSSVVVLAEQTSQSSNIVTRKLKITMPDEEVREITHFQFLSWPDVGEPEDPVPLLELRYQVRSHCVAAGAEVPLLVHCVYGAARTGVFIAVDALIDEYSTNGSARVFHFVKKMRKSRPAMIRTLGQYMFIYECIFEEFEAGSTLVTKEDARRIFLCLKRKNPLTKNTYIKDQYLLLEAYTPALNPKFCQEALSPINKYKNRDKNILPPDKYRPRLTLDDGDDRYHDYINAVFIDSYRYMNEYIITQTPSKITVTEFWQLVNDHNIDTIVHIGSCIGSNIVEYFPTDSTFKFGPFTIKHIRRDDQDPIIIHDFKFSHKRQETALKLFHLNIWETEGVQSRRMEQHVSISDIIRLQHLFTTWQKICNKHSHPVLVVCNDGATNSGLLVASTVICETVDQLGHVDIYHTTKHIRRRRPQIIANGAQYRFLYKVLLRHVGYPADIENGVATASSSIRASAARSDGDLCEKNNSLDQGKDNSSNISDIDLDSISRYRRDSRCPSTTKRTKSNPSVSNTQKKHTKQCRENKRRRHHVSRKRCDVQEIHDDSPGTSDCESYSDDESGGDCYVHRRSKARPNDHSAWDNDESSHITDVCEQSSKKEDICEIHQNCRPCYTVKRNKKSVKQAGHCAPSSKKSSPQIPKIDCTVTPVQELQPFGESQYSGRVTPLTLFHDRVTPVTPCHDRVTPLTPCNDRVTPVTPCHDRVTPLTPCHDRVTPVTPCHDRVTPLTPCNDRVTPLTPCNDRVTPLTPCNDRVTPLTPCLENQTAQFCQESRVANDAVESFSLGNSFDSSQSSDIDIALHFNA